MNWALEVTQLRKSFGNVMVTQDIDLRVASGERRLIIGPKGAGKTTLFAQITGEIHPDSGRVQVLGVDVTHESVQKRAHVGLSRTYQIINLFHKNTVLHNVALSLMGISKQRFDAFHVLKPRDAVYDRAFDFLQQVGLEDKAHKLLGEMSYGEQRRVEIAVAVCQCPKILLLDEPLAGLSKAERQLVQQLINELPKSMAIVMIEHDMDVALAFAEKISVLHHGSLVVEGDRDTVVNHPKTREVYLGH